MSDLWMLLAVMAVFYVLEGVWFVPPGALGISRSFWGRFRTQQPLVLGRAGIELLPPPSMVASPERFVAPQEPPALSPAGVAFRGIGPEGAPSVFLSYEEAAGLERRGARLMHRGRKLVDAGSPAAAGSCLGLLREIASLGAAQRAGRIHRELEKRLDVRDARRRLRRYRLALRDARYLAPLLLLNTFVLAPATGLTVGLPRSWVLLLTYHALLTGLVTFCFLRLSRRLRLPVAGDRFSTSMTLLLFPPAAMRWNESLARGLFSGLHPVAVAVALLPREGIAEVARPFLVAPGGATAAGTGDQAAGVERWHQGALAGKIVAALDAAGLAASDVLEAPASETGAGAYCPRCHAQYREEVWECADCPGVPLAGFTGELGRARIPAIRGEQRPLDADAAR